jgi:hypothetical protein
MIGFMTRLGLGLVFRFVEEKTAGHGNAIVTALEGPVNLMLTFLIDDDSYRLRKEILDQDPKLAFSTTCNATTRPRKESSEGRRERRVISPDFFGMRPETGWKLVFSPGKCASYM